MQGYVAVRGGGGSGGDSGGVIVGKEEKEATSVTNALDGWIRGCLESARN